MDELITGLTMPDGLETHHFEDVEQFNARDLFWDDCNLCKVANTCGVMDNEMVQIFEEIVSEPTDWSLLNGSQGNLSLLHIMQEDLDGSSPLLPSPLDEVNPICLLEKRCATHTPRTFSRNKAVGVRNGAVRKVTARGRIQAQRPTAMNGSDVKEEDRVINPSQRQNTKPRKAIKPEGGAKSQKPQGKPIEAARKGARALSALFVQVPMPADAGSGGNNLKTRHINEIFTTALGDDKFIGRLWERFGDGLWGEALSGGCRRSANRKQINRTYTRLWTCFMLP